MEGIKLNVATLCAYMGMTTEQLAEHCGIGVAHLINIRQGRAKMSADDVIALSNGTRIAVDHIETAKEKQ